MATYNGASYLPFQIDSILEQMGADDELIVVDDASSDATVAYLEQLKDCRIRLYQNNTNLGHVQSFSKAVSLARQPYIIMSDQDDIWIKGRIHLMTDALSAGWALVSTNCEYVNSEGIAIPPLQSGLTDVGSHRHFANIFDIFSGQAPYYGCAMALREELRCLILPIPSYVESHDLWIAMAANVARSNLHLEQATLLRRVHGTNASVVARPLLQKIWSRIIFLRSFIEINRRLLKNGNRFRIVTNDKIP